MTTATETKPQIILGAPPAHGEIWPGQGGRFICTLPALLGMPARHLVAALSDCGNDDTIYGPYGADVPGAISDIDGRANTAALLAAGDEYNAAKLAAAHEADGHTDFFLPSRLDLFMAHICAHEHFEKSGWYWSSTQYSRGSAFVQGFADGDSGWDGKDGERRVRAFRVVQLESLTT